MLTSAYWEVEDVAVEGKRDLTVETNLRNDFLVNRCDFFKNKGYTTNLIYMLLPDIETSIERVSLRIAQKGHFVDIESMKYNFEQGLVNLKKYFNRFDNQQIIYSSLQSSPSFPIPLLTIKNNNDSFIDSNAPIWAKLILDELVNKLATH